MAMQKPVLQITASIDKNSTVKKVQSDLDSISKKLTLTIGVDKDGNKTLKETTTEAKKLNNIHTEALRMNREYNKTLKDNEKYYNYQMKTQMSINKQSEKRLQQEKLTTSELDKQRQKLELFQAEMDRKSQKLTTGKFKGTVDQSSLSSLQDRVSGLSIGDASDIKSVQAEMNKINSEFKNIALNAQQARTGFTRFGDEAKNSLVKFSEFFLIGGVVVGFLGQIQQAISTVYELSNALNEIRIVTNKSVEEVNKLGKSYNALAKELSSTTTEITKASAELFRQGLNDEQVNERLQATVKYAKISGLSIEESSKIITANANATGKSVNSIIDIMAKLGDETATGADEIGLAMSKVAGSAKVAGIPFEQLAAQIATVSSKTRESASTIGNSLFIATSYSNVC